MPLAKELVHARGIRPCFAGVCGVGLSDSAIILIVNPYLDC